MNGYALHCILLVDRPHSVPDCGLLDPEHILHWSRGTRLCIRKVVTGYSKVGDTIPTSWDGLTHERLDGDACCALSPYIRIPICNGIKGSIRAGNEPAGSLSLPMSAYPARRLAGTQLRVLASHGRHSGMNSWVKGWTFIIHL